MEDKINLRIAPFFLNDEQVQWVEKTLMSMNIEDKIGQLFCPIGLSFDREELREIITKYKPCGMMFRPAQAEIIKQTHKFLQNESQIPLLISANLESGGSGIVLEGTLFGCQMQVAATGNDKRAYQLGEISANEAKSVGCNWAFAPVVDIDMNFRNPITNTRTYGNDIDRIIRMSKEYISAMHNNSISVSPKHFPGDGVDDRDPHLVIGVNNLNCDQWDETYGKIYKALIKENVISIMIGHIMLPAYSRKFKPGIKDSEIRPASLAPEILNNLLRKKLGFNGVIVSDATPMLGFTLAGPRCMTVPASIEAGCDIFLFNKSLEEDYRYMRDGVYNGLLSIRRLNDAVTRILAMKASMNMHSASYKELLFSTQELDGLSSNQHRTYAYECADEAITLVKDTQNLLPIDLMKIKKILIIPLGDGESLQGNDGGIIPYFINKLEERGLNISIFPREDFTLRDMCQSVEKFIEPYDMVLYAANLKTASNQSSIRINWQPPMGVDAPWFLNEVPSIFISFANPYHLQDVPQMKTFINCYTGSEFVVDKLIEKLFGESEFKGRNPIDPFCGYWEAKL